MYEVTKNVIIICKWGVMVLILKPQKGPQEDFLANIADIVIYGGAAGGGKTFGLLLEPLRHIDNKDFGVVIFRRVSTQINAEGGLWDTALQMYIPLGISYKTQPYQITFPSGAKITFSHLQYEKDVYSYQGSQIPLICFDELTHFTETQFWYMLSRNRSLCGVKPYIRATCNPDADSWVKGLISWWLDDEGFPIRERSGVVRYFFRKDGEVIGGDTRQELMEKYDKQDFEIKSLTFVPSSIYDNQILLDTNPEYLGSLQALSAVEQGRLLHGNWNIKPSAGLYFKKEQFIKVKSVPGKITGIWRAWDLAGTAINNENKDPDRTAGVLIARLDSGHFIVLDAKREALNAHGVRQLIKNTGLEDRANWKCNNIRIPQDPGQAGKEQAYSYVSYLSGFNVKVKTVTGSKATRAEPFTAQVQAGNVYLLWGKWNEMYLRELEGFPDLTHDDLVDASSDAFTECSNSVTWGGFLD